MNKKGMDISLNFIILAVLALIALIIVALFFTGGLGKLFEQTGDVGDVTGEEIALAQAKCVTYCYAGSETSWDNPGFSETVEAEWANCDLLLETTWDHFSTDEDEGGAGCDTDNI